MQKSVWEHPGGFDEDRFMRGTGAKVAWVENSKIPLPENWKKGPGQSANGDRKGTLYYTTEGKPQWNHPSSLEIGQRIIHVGGKNVATESFDDILNSIASLPEGWKAVTESDGKTYYVDTKANTS